MLSRYLLVCSIISSLLVLLVQIFRWQIVEAFTPFFFPFILTAVYGFFIITRITSVILMFVKRKWKSVVIQIVTIILFFTVPFNQMILKWNFYMKKEARAEVIEKIDNGDLKPNVDYNDSLIQLPNEYAHVTSGGNDIVVEEDGAVFFFLHIEEY